MHDSKNIQAIILAGSRDFGRCSLITRLPTVLWPVIGKPVLQLVLDELSSQGVNEAVICSNGDGAVIRKTISAKNSMRLDYMDEKLPLGTAGCIREAVKAGNKTQFIVLHGCITTLPNINLLVNTNAASKSKLTISLEPSGNDKNKSPLISEIYLCKRAVLDYIPPKGYFDIKEGLIPAMLKRGEIADIAKLDKPTGNFRCRNGYLSAIANYLENNKDILDTQFPSSHWNHSANVWLAENTKIGPDVRIYGPVVIMDDATVSDKAIILGPAIIGRNAVIGKNSFLENSVLWDGCVIGQNCEIRNSIIDYNAVVPDKSSLYDKAVGTNSGRGVKVLLKQLGSLLF